MQWRSLRDSARARASIRNALYGATEYIVLPLTMLLATPFLLHRLGIVQFGLWVLASAAVTSSNLISTGFGDGALKYASMYRGKADASRFEHTVRVNVTIRAAGLERRAFRFSHRQRDSDRPLYRKRADRCATRT